MEVKLSIVDKNDKQHTADHLIPAEELYPNTQMAMHYHWCMLLAQQLIVMILELNIHFHCQQLINTIAKNKYKKKNMNKISYHHSKISFQLPSNTIAFQKPV